MFRPRLVFFCFLLAATAAGAQTSPSGPAASSRVSKEVHKAARSQHGTYEITIAFKRTYRGKLRTDKTYTLLATTGDLLPAIRDDSRFRTDASCTDQACTIEGATDVDILRLQPRGDAIYIALKISTQTIGMDEYDFLPKLPVAGTHQYLVTPTMPIGRRIIVYSALDANNNTSVEVSLLIEPFDPKQSEQPK
jgi:hypothetical protein